MPRPPLPFRRRPCFDLGWPITNPYCIARLLASRESGWLSQDGIVQTGRWLGLGPFVLRRRARKMRVLGDSLALGFTGPVALAGMICWQAATFGCDTLDGAETLIPQIWRRMTARARGVGFAVNAVGWSERRRRMAGLSFWHGDGMTAEECLD